MNYRWVFYLHVGIAYLVVFFTIVSIILEIRIRNTTQSQEKRAASNRILLQLTRWSSYGLLILFLLGGYMGTPYFKIGFAGHYGWIYIKLLLFIFLLGWMGGIGSRLLKKRGQLLQSGVPDENAWNALLPRINVYISGQVLLIAFIFYLAYGKPF